MSTSFDVAARYARHPGGVYELLLPLDPMADHAIIDLDDPFPAQEQSVQEVTSSCLPSLGYNVDIALLRDAPFQTLYLRLVTRVAHYLPSLLQRGIWGCRGHMPASLSSGAMDRGLQLISLRPETMLIARFSPATNLYSSPNCRPA